jgi:hypothetical protein
MRLSRRDFVKSATASGIALSIMPLAIAGEPGFAARETRLGRQGWNPAATGVGRIDGVAKVTGAKLYASDFRAADLPDWPQATSHAMLVRAADATHVYEGLDLSRLSGALKPSVVVTAADLSRVGVRVPAFYAGDLLCPVGKTPLYLGQPVALLVFEDFDAFDQARLALRDAPVLKYGEETGPVKMPNYAAFRFTRVGGPTPDAPDVYSPVKNGWDSPGFTENSGHPIWAQLPLPTGQAHVDAAKYGEKIRAELAASNPALLVLDREFETQSVDPMFLEPESGIAWYDAGRQSLELVVGVQSPYEAAESVAYLLGNAPMAPSSRRTSTPTSPIAAAGSVGATIRRSRFTSRWRRCSSPIVASGWRTTASSSSNRESSGMPSRCARKSGSIGRPARSSPWPPTRHWMAEASPIFHPLWRAQAPMPRSASTMLQK